MIAPPTAVAAAPPKFACLSSEGHPASRQSEKALLQPALARPYQLDDATVARTIRVHRDQADDLVLFQNQADKWSAMPGLTPAQRAAVQEYEAAIGELRRLNAEVLAAAEQLKRSPSRPCSPSPTWRSASRPCSAAIGGTDAVRSPDGQLRATG